MSKRKVYCDDFETITDAPTRVWAWSSVNIDNPDTSFRYGNDLESYFAYVSRETSIRYFRNFKFDGEFILHYLFTHGFIHTTDKEPAVNEFTTLISDTGKFYSFKIKFINGNTVELRDSLKIIPMSISDSAKAFGLQETKLVIDYHKERPPGYELQTDEVNYIKNDVTIDAKSLQYFFNQRLTKMTIGSNALYDYKQILLETNKKNFRQIYPALDEETDAEIRKAYKGGYVFCNPLNQNKTVRNGIVVDINSHFPARMYYELLPYGQPVYFKGKYKPNKFYPLYTIHIKTMFVLKDGKLPTIQIKHTLHFNEIEYLTNSNNEVVDLWLTNVDYELFCENYDLYYEEFIDGYMFRACISESFRAYVDKWMSIKIASNDNKGLRTLAKLMLNNLYGKFGLNMHVGRKIPYYENGIIKYKTMAKELREGIYIPVAAFITAYARAFTIRSCQKVRDYSLDKYGFDAFLYTDTDSIHCLLNDSDIKECLDCDKTALGKWKIESHFTSAKFLRSKCYLEEIDGELKPTIAGMPKNMHDLVTFDNFNIGQTYEKKDGKKRFKHVEGGVILVDVPYSIK